MTPPDETGGKKAKRERLKPFFPSHGERNDIGSQYVRGVLNTSHVNFFGLQGGFFFAMPERCGKYRLEMLQRMGQWENGKMGDEGVCPTSEDKTLVLSCPQDFPHQ